MNKKRPRSPQIVNRSARFNYSLEEEFVVGLSLSGPEVRAARLGHVQIKGAYATIRSDELWLIGASFSLNTQGKDDKTVDDRTRRLLAHRKQIDDLAAAKKQGFTIVPTKLLTDGRYIKLVIALGKGKKLWDKRETIKQRDLERESRR
ncbi:SsrA-binding protein SmpB [Candidatus Saccharibacteria bacterium]|nr:SsrA-binding protein SmpB [Candidatus Saccharibacteria bacterium]